MKCSFCGQPITFAPSLVLADYNYHLNHRIGIGKHRCETAADSGKRERERRLLRRLDGEAGKR
jgi:hypothetical protein